MPASSSSSSPDFSCIVADEVVHLVQRLGRRLDDQVDAVAEHVEVEVGDQRGHLDQGVGPEVEAGHLAVDPHESVVHERPPYRHAPARGSPQDPLSARLRPRTVAVGRREGVVRAPRAAGRPAGSGSWPARSRCPTPPRACGRSAPTTCCPEAVVPDGRPPAARRSRSWSALAWCSALLTRAAGRACRRCCSWRSSSASPRPGRAACRSSAAASAAAASTPTPTDEVPVGDRPRRRPAAAVAVAGLAPAHPARPSTHLLFRRTDLKESRCPKTTAHAPR